MEPSIGGLPPDVRRALAALSVFESPFDPADAEAVLGPPSLDAVGALVARSLVRVQAGRYALWSLVRDCARLEARDEDRDAHARWLARLGEPERFVHRIAARSRRHAEADLRAALAW